jgi:hypothetical protein
VRLRIERVPGYSKDSKKNEKEEDDEDEQATLEFLEELERRKRKKKKKGKSLTFRETRSKTATRNDEMKSKWKRKEILYTSDVCLNMW